MTFGVVVSLFGFLFEGHSCTLWLLCLSLGFRYLLFLLDLSWSLVICGEIFEALFNVILSADCCVCLYGHFVRGGLLLLLVNVVFAW